MPRTCKVIESIPGLYPPVEGIKPDLVPVVWQRIESWIALRWGTREIELIVEGLGEWMPPLEPVTMLTTEVWHNNNWVSAVTPPTPLGGYKLECVGPFRFRGIAGLDEAPPACVIEACRRLGEFFTDTDLLESVSIEGVGAFSFKPGVTNARAMQYSGAADLLRPYRHLGEC